ncbi:MAG: helix-turn-helix transcriptional regulator [Sediminibacterium sp.]|nr:helix-turn-helix transcriptional regulator [Sediminibacterium sp.]
MNAIIIFFLDLFRQNMRNQENIAPIDQYVIDFVRDLRIKKELTQEDIANIIEISRSFVRDIESINSRAKFNVRHINALADYFGMSPRNFFPEKALPVSSHSRKKEEMKVIKKITPEKVNKLKKKVAFVKNKNAKNK